MAITSTIPSTAPVQVNNFTIGTQSAPQMIALSGGGSIIAWDSDGQDGSGLGVYFRLQDNLGNFVGGEFQAFASTAGNQSLVGAFKTPDGGFWLTASNGAAYVAQRFDAAGARVGAEIAIDAGQPMYDLTPLSDGRFVAIMGTYPNTIGGPTNKARIFDATGQQVGGELDLAGWRSQLDALSGGGFAVANFANAGATTRRFYDGSANLTFVGGNYHYGTAALGTPNVLATNDGGAVFIERPPPGMTRVTRLDASGNVVGSGEIIGGDVTNISSISAVVNADNSVAVIASYFFSTADRWLNVLDASGQLAGPPQNVGPVGSATIAALPGGGYMVAWASNGEIFKNIVAVPDADGVFTDAAENIYGDAAANTIDGRGGADLIDGYLGDDVIRGGDGSDTISGGEGLDTLYGEEGHDTLYGAAGNDTLDGGAGNDVLWGGNGDDILTSGSGTDTLRGGENNDTLTGGEGRDNLFGENGNDTLYAAVDFDVLEGGNGDDKLYAGTGSGQMYGGENDDLLVAGTNPDGVLMLGGGGNDTLIGSETVAATAMGGGPGNDIYLYWVGTITELANEGIDELQTYNASQALPANFEILRGLATTGQVLRGNAASNTIYGGSGNDVLYGDTDGLSANESSDILNGGDGADILVGGEKADILNGDGGIDYASYSDAAGAVLVDFAAPGNNTGEAQGDLYTDIEGIIGSNFADTLRASAAGTILIGGAGADTLVGNVGIDYASYASSGAAVQIKLLDPGSWTGDAAGDTYTAIEGIIGSVFNDTLEGDAGDNRFLGGGGNDFLFGDAGADTLWGDVGDDGLNGWTGDDVLEGGDGHDYLSGGDDNDTLSGGFGNDTLDGGAGTDAMAGGAGDDVYIVDSATDTVMENPNEGNDIAYSFVTWLPAANIETVILAGTVAINATGTAAGDIIGGNGSQNFIAGMDGDDWLDGGGGNDFLYGMGGADTLFGGAGADTFVYLTALDSALSAGIDAIQDFLTGTDKIDLTAVRASAGDSFSFLRAYGNSYLYVDLLGDGTQDMIVAIAGNQTIGAADLIWG